MVKPRRVRNYSGTYTPAKKPYEPARRFWTVGPEDVGYLTAAIFATFGVAIAEGIKLGQRRLDEQNRRIPNSP